MKLNLSLILCACLVLSACSKYETVAPTPQPDPVNVEVTSTPPVDDLSLPPTDQNEEGQVQENSDVLNTPGSTDSSPDTSNNCNIANTEANLSNKLAAAVTDTDFSLLLKRADGKFFTYSRGTSTPNTYYSSASTSKMITAAVILRLVEKGVLKLTDSPQKYLSNWPISASDSLYTMNLSHLLSFTSGLESAPACTDNAFANFFDCVNTIALINKGNGRKPGNTYYYESTHLQVAGAMAIKAAGKNSWTELFADFKSETGLFTTTKFNLPSILNPRLAGGATWTGAEYLQFLEAYRDGKVLSPMMFQFASTDKIADARIISAPAMDVIGEAWHYGYGMWIECNSSIFNCTETKVVSSPGAYGAYPFIDVQTKLIGILARQGELRTFGKGYELFKSVDKEIRDWEECK